MSLAIEEQVERVRELLQHPEIKEAMAVRCAEQGHAFEDCLTIFFVHYQRCKWCGKQQ